MEGLQNYEAFKEEIEKHIDGIDDLFTLRNFLETEYTGEGRQELSRLLNEAEGKLTY